MNIGKVYDIGAYFQRTYISWNEKYTCKLHEFILKVYLEYFIVLNIDEKNCNMNSCIARLIMYLRN